MHRLLEGLDVGLIRKVPSILGVVLFHVHKFTFQRFLLQVQVRQLFLILFGQIFGRFPGDDIPQLLVILILFQPVFEFLFGVLQVPVDRSGGLLAKQVRKLTLGVLRQGFKFSAFQGQQLVIDDLLHGSQVLELAVDTCLFKWYRPDRRRLCRGKVNGNTLRGSVIPTIFPKTGYTGDRLLGSHVEDKSCGQRRQQYPTSRWLSLWRSQGLWGILDA